MSLLSSGFVGLFCFVVFFCSAKARGFLVRSWEACGGVVAPAGPSGPSPKVFFCPRLPLAGPLPPAASAARDAGTAPPPSQLLKAIVSIACSSLLLSRCRRACSSFSSAAKIWGREGRRQGEEMPSYPKRLLAARGHAGSSTASGHGHVAPRKAVHVHSRPSQGQERAKGGARWRTPLECCHPTGSSATPKGLQ